MNCTHHQKMCFSCKRIGFIVFALLFLTGCTSHSKTEQKLSNSQEFVATKNPVPYSFTGQVSRGEKFEKTLPGNLVFALLPTTYAEIGWVGWNIHLGSSSESSHNYAGVVTLPLRGTNDLQIIGWHFRNEDNTGPNDGSIYAPQEERFFSYILNEENYQIASDAVECIMWPLLCEEMDTHEAIDLHQSVPTMGGRLLITNLELGNLEPGRQPWIEYMEFEVELNLPTELEN